MSHNLGYNKFKHIFAKILLQKAKMALYYMFEKSLQKETTFNLITLVGCYGMYLSWKS